jgi:hypothetical protein
VKSLLFLEKKKQKNFIHWQPALSPTGSHMKKVFLLLFFSKKEDSSCLPLAWVFGFSGERSIQKKKTLPSAYLSTRTTTRAAAPSVSMTVRR